MVLDELDHVSLERMQAFERGELCLEELSAIESHLESCAACCQRLIDNQTPDEFISNLSDFAKSESTLANRWGTPANVVPHPGKLEIPGYALFDELGRGAFGVVFKAKHIRLNRLAAVKVLAARVGEDPVVEERFLREAQTLAQLSHPNIVGIYDIGQTAGHHFIAMEFVKGSNLAHRLEQRPTDLSTTLRLGLQICKALEFIHAQGIVHRDIKPENILLDANDNVKLSDFGLVKLQEEAGSALLSSAQTIMGTPAYMAPEQARGETIDARADLFSFGVVLYRLCVGKLPFPGSNATSVLMALASHHPEPPHALHPSISPQLSDLIMQLLAKNPALRPASAIKVRQELERLANPGDSAHRSSPSGLSLWRRKGILVAVAIALMLIPTGAWLADIVLKIETTQGTLLIKLHDQNLMVAVRDARNIPMKQKSTGREFLLNTTKGEVQIFESDGEHLLLSRPFELQKGKQTTLDIDAATIAEAREKVAAEITKALEALPWTPLFNGKDLTGWKYAPQLPGDWRVESEQLTCEGGRRSWLFSQRGDYGDFLLRCEFKCSPNCDSGIFFWTPFELKKFPDGALNPVHWHEVNIDNDGKLNFTGSVDGQGMQAPAQEAIGAVDEWVTLEILAAGTRITSRVNGKQVASGSFPSAKQGHFALQTPVRDGTTIQIRKLEIKSSKRKEG